MIATRSSAKAPVSTHPLFPAIVALWFAALLGLGSMILPTVLLERLVTVTGLSSLLPMAAPPLGFTARTMLAIGAASIGAVLGMVIARRVADSHAPRSGTRFSRGAAPTCKPISAHDELGSEGLGSSGFGSATFGTNTSAPAAQKRRSLAIKEDNRRSAYLQQVPLPGEGDPVPLPADESDDALELGEFAAVEEPSDVSDQDDTMTDGTNFSPPHEAAEFTDESQDFAAPEPIEPEEEEDEEEAVQVEALQFEAPSLRRKQEVPSFLAAYDFDDEEDEEVEPAETAVAANSFEPEQRQFDRAAPAQPQFAVVEPEPDIAAAIAAGVDDRPLDDLGLVQLAARLGASIERRRAMRASLLHGQVMRPAPVFAASPEDFDAAAAEDAARARASFFAPQQAEPKAVEAPAVPSAYEPEPEETDEADEVGAFEPFEGFGGAEELEEEEDSRPLLASKPSPLRDISFDDEDDGDESALSASLAIPRRTQQRPFDAAFDDEAFAGEEEEDDSEFSSLLTMANPFQKKNEFVRIEEPEPDEDETEAAVTFPTVRNPANEVARPFDPPASVQQAAAQADPGDAERELRAALATLQRMSGAA